ncbi:hypothetical protein GS429_15900 [Natronorubrum sp. JWXQ-INN-674]|uniref:Uncharacterized protein n=1 Tax=Natronorubrum halalkaliphilum TaxID=2691917 RepID=A0A6B0VRV7_9EURY|nr:hypothetical protein [Natronorubrum halalkaliphilum]MXV63512.1 hypothetical protein [Natronorubrum halalkaliphilum]
MDAHELERISSTDDPYERMGHVFTEGGPIEAMAKRSAINPLYWIEAEPRSDEDKTRLMREAEQVELEPGEAVLVHESNPRRAESIVEQGFDDPFDHAGDDLYHIPGSVRYGRVFLWPHVDMFGAHDINGAAVICRARIDNVLVSSYASHSALTPEDRYERSVQGGYHYDKIPPEEYNELHVFEYSDYLRWIEEGGGGDWSADSLFPYVLE